jgi:hypothetical protein
MAPMAVARRGHQREARNDAPGHLRWAAAVGGVAALAGAYYPHAIDDAYISHHYAYALAERGELSWHGDRFEGYSNFAWVLLQALVVRLGGGDLPRFSKLVALGCGMALVAVAARALPAGRRGALGLAALVLWTPLAFWSAMAMETTLFTLLAAVGWLWVQTGRRGGLWLLGASALVRPEGSLWLALGLAAGWRGADARGRSIAAAVAALVLGYHAWRLRYFGDALPSAIPLKLLVGFFGPLQLAFEAAAGAGVLAACALFRLPRREALWAAAPLALSVVMLLAMNGDWMGPSRILMPGAVAMLLVRGARGQARGGTRRLAVTAALVAAAGVFETRFLELPTLRRLVPRYGAGLETPLWAVTDWLGNHAPAGALVQSADVGMIGHVPQLRVIDARGLTSRRFTRRARGDDDAALRAYYQSSERPDLIAVGRYVPLSLIPAGVEVPPLAGLDPWLAHLDGEVLPHYPDRVDLRYEETGWLALIRVHRAAPAEAPPALRVERWRRLHQRFPSQPWIEWQLALAHAADGDEAAALAVARASRFPDYEPFRDLPAALALPSGGVARYAAGRGFLFAAGETRQSLPFRHPQVLEVEAAQSVEVDAVDAGVPCTAPLTVEGPAEVVVPACAVWITAHAAGYARLRPSE